MIDRQKAELYEWGTPDDIMDELADFLDSLKLKDEQYDKLNEILKKISREFQSFPDNL